MGSVASFWSVLGVQRFVWRDTQTSSTLSSLPLRDSNWRTVSQPNQYWFNTLYSVPLPGRRLTLLDWPIDLIRSQTGTDVLLPHVIEDVIRQISSRKNAYSFIIILIIKLLTVHSNPSPDHPGCFTKNVWIFRTKRNINNTLYTSPELLSTDRFIIIFDYLYNQLVSEMDPRIQNF